MTFGMCVFVRPTRTVETAFNIVCQIWSDKAISNLYSIVTCSVLHIASHPSYVSGFTDKQKVSGRFRTQPKYN